MYSSCFTLSSTNTPTHARPNHWCRQEFGGEGVFVAQQRRVCAGGGGRRRAIDLPACRLRELLPSEKSKFRETHWFYGALHAYVH